MAKNSWDWDAVYEALAERFGTNESPVSPLTWLYPQKFDCAVLYSPRSKAFKKHPLHMHPGIDGWKPKVYKAILSAIEFEMIESKSVRNRNFLCFRVEDWNAFAKALEL